MMRNITSSTVRNINQLQIYVTFMTGHNVLKCKTERLLNSNYLATNGFKGGTTSKIFQFLDSIGMCLFSEQ